MDWLERRCDRISGGDFSMTFHVHANYRDRELEEGISRSKQTVYLESKIIDTGDFYIPDPEFGDVKLNVFPFINSVSNKRVYLPECFKLWELSVNEIAKLIPLQDGANQHYVTIDSKFFSSGDFLRREGLHLDGNFCVDPNFMIASWGGAYYDKRVIVKKDWILPYDIDFPVGAYISNKKGGIFCVSTEVGCQAWEGNFEVAVRDGGDLSEYNGSLENYMDVKKIILEKNKLYFMNSTTPHETLYIEKGKRRTLIRITLNHEYQNDAIFSKFKEIIQ
jgi:hypothetical protein